MSDRRPQTGAAALEALLDGNRRFVSGMSQHPNLTALHRNDLVEGQKPFATILACSDSRVAPEHLFDQGLGDLFVIRVAGNVVDESVAASVAYAVEVLKTPLVVVLGHENCGAVGAALQSRKEQLNLPPALGPLLQRIQPALGDVDLPTAVEANVRQSLENLKELCGPCDGADPEDALAVGGVYSLRTGEVTMLGD